MARRRRPGRVRRATLAAAKALGLLVLGTFLAVVALRFVAPPATAFMVERWFSAKWSGDAEFELRYRWVPFDEISAHAAMAVVAAEDQNFATHFGFDFASLGDAVEDYRRGEALRGASTISQQVAKNLFLWSGRSFARKGIEAYLTTLIELTWPKRRILEMYLNVAEFGDGIYGVEAASRAFFRKRASALTAGEAALLAAVLPNPRRLRVSRPSRYVQTRQAWILRQMSQLGGTAYLQQL